MQILTTTRPGVAPQIDAGKWSPLFEAVAATKGTRLAVAVKLTRAGINRARVALGTTGKRLLTELGPVRTQVVGCTLSVWID